MRLHIKRLAQWLLPLFSAVTALHIWMSWLVSTFCLLLIQWLSKRVISRPASPGSLLEKCMLIQAIESQTDGERGKRTAVCFISLTGDSDTCLNLRTITLHHLPSSTWLPLTRPVFTLDLSTSLLSHPDSWTVLMGSTSLLSVCSSPWHPPSNVTLDQPACSWLINLPFQVPFRPLLSQKCSVAHPLFTPWCSPQISVYWFIPSPGN